ncbi:MAG: sodium:dicarboxylate symporter [Lentisphaerae bacterium RIFOXYB12_FULL_65_16]|nr:MAG: sodium:dicarboxylate symporter [Lentisphaerae bacterium RIFOXYA12_64_32]OGV87530.1 MAG: sodium:dicarboxylate symporter [Lentisphaerae bacterium RIFOXYB12_FULL_65_16]
MLPKKLTLTHYIFIGFFLGIPAGRFGGPAFLPVADVLAEVFLRLLRMAIVPLIVTSIVSAVVSVGHLGRIGVKTFCYYIASSLMAILTGQILVNVLRPGVGANINLEDTPQHIAAAQQTVRDILLHIIPENPFASMAEGDVLPVIFFSILFGLFVARLKEKSRTQLSDLFHASFEAMLKMTLFVVWSAPLGVFGIVARIVAKTGFDSFRSLGFYFVVVLIGLAIHMFVNLPLLLLLVGRVNPIKHYKGMVQALIFGFSTCSTMVTLPLTMKAVTGNSRVPKEIAGFTLPLGATVNMDGTALYECVAAIFIAQVYGFHLTMGAQLTITLTALLASIGAASVPMSGLVMMSIILKAVGLPLEGVGIILAVDRILDMFRTTLNILSDSCGAVIVARLEGESLEGMGEPLPAQAEA